MPTRVLIAMLGIGLCAACATNPVTGKSQLMLMSESQEISMGKQMLAQTEQESGFYSDAALQSYVSDIGMRMARASERPNLPWEYHVIDDPAVNAFAAPGGYIFVTRGILTYLNSEAELAAVLGHETGHVTARHSAAMASQQMLAQGGLAIGGIVRPDIAQGVVGQLVNTGASLYFLKFSRNDEKQADGIGHRYALKQKYDPREMPKTFQTLQRVSNTGSNKMPGFLSTHPDPGDRVAYTTAWADTVKSFAGLSVDRDRYLARINGLLFGDDPEQGYFEGVRYLHPTLKLRFDAPTGWQGANQRQQVVLAEPNGKAQITMSQAKETTPDAAAQAFAAQQGIANLGTQRTTINGENATVVQFSAKLQDSTAIRGEAYFIQHGGSVFQFLGVALGTAWPTLSTTIDQSLRSFGPTAGNQQFKPRKYLRIVTLSRATSVSDLAAQSNGAISLQDLAIINGVAETATLGAGTKVKTVGYR
jgi:predicted Zn-dependent protease